jgi:hypothetical protein
MMLGNARAHGGGFRAVVAQAQHAQRVAEAGEAEADTALVGGFLRWRSSGQAVTSSTLSSMRVETLTTSPKAAKSNSAWLEKGA